MAVYRLIALLADLNTLPCVNPQVYQARGVAVAKFTLHIVSLSGCLCPYHAKKGYPDPTQGKDTPTKKHKKAATAAFLCVVVFVFKRSMLRLLVLFYGYGCASALLRLLARLGLGLWLASALLLPCWSSSALLPLDNHRQ